MNCFWSFIQVNFLELFQGFQLITMLKPSNVPQIFGTNQTNQRYYLGSSPQVSHMSGLMRARPREEQTVCVKFSYSNITIKSYRTRPCRTWPDQTILYWTVQYRIIPYITTHHTILNQTNLHNTTQKIFYGPTSRVGAFRFAFVCPDIHIS